MAVECNASPVVGRLRDGIPRVEADRSATAGRLQVKRPLIAPPATDGNKTLKKRKEGPSPALVPVRPQDSVDILERVLTKGAVVEGAREDAGASEGEDSATLRVSIAGVDLLNVRTDLSWRSLDEPEQPGRAAE